MLSCLPVGSTSLNLVLFGSWEEFIWDSWLALVSKGGTMIRDYHMNKKRERISYEKENLIHFVHVSRPSCYRTKWHHSITLFNSKHNAIEIILIHLVVNSGLNWIINDRRFLYISTKLISFANTEIQKKWFLTSKHL